MNFSRPDVTVLRANPTTEFVVPFLLVFAFLYAALQNSGMFQFKGAQRINAVIALLMSFIFSVQPTYRSIIWNNMAFVALLIGIASLISFVQKNIWNKIGGDGAKPTEGHAYLAIILIALIGAAGAGPLQGRFGDASQTILFIVALAAFAVIVKASSSK